jgi:hypothetical protein
MGMEQVTEQPAAETKIDPHSQVVARVHTELTRLVEQIGLTKAERSIAGVIAINIRNISDQVMSLSAIAPEEQGRLVSAGIAIALKASELRNEVCTCPKCLEKRIRNAGWRGRIRRAVAAFKAAWNA